jgi:hypothetical protein
LGDYENQKSARADDRTRWLGQLLSRNHQNMLKIKLLFSPRCVFCCMLLLYFPGFGIVFIGMLPVIAIWKIIMPYHFVEEIGLRSAHRDSAMKCSPWPKDHCSRHIRIILYLKQTKVSKLTGKKATSSFVFWKDPDKCSNIYVSLQMWVLHMKPKSYVGGFLWFYILQHVLHDLR